MVHARILALVPVWSLVCLAGTLAAQNPGDDAIRARLDRLEAENRDLRVANEDLRTSVQRLEEQVTTRDESHLESEINALVARHRLDTTLNSAADPITIYGEFRSRGTVVLGDLLPAFFDTEHDGWYVDSILRLGFQFDFGEHLTAFAELQGHWAWGDEASTESNPIGPIVLPNEPTIEVRIHQAWVEVRNLFGVPELSTRIGRQEILLGRQFHFGNAEWYNGFSFDALNLTWNDEDFTIRAYAAKLSSPTGDFNQFPTFFLPRDDDELFALYTTLRVIENHEIDLYWIYLNAQGTGGAFGGGTSAGSSPAVLVTGSPRGGNAFYSTVGGRIGGVFPDVLAGLDWNLEAAYQFGDLNTLGDTDFRLNAGTAELEVGLTLSAESKFRVFTRWLWADEEYVFLYGTRHFHDGIRARYGIHDLIPMWNVVSGQLGVHFDPGEDWTIGATGLWAQSEDDFAFVEGGREWGWEADLWAEYRHSAQFVVSGGAAFFFPGAAMLGFLPLPSDEMQTLVYLQARLLF